MLMPEIATFQKYIVYRKCSKCKHTKEAHFVQLAAAMLKTCNACRFRARQLSRAEREPALTAAGFYDHDHVAAASESLSSSASASTAAVDYSVDEPDPEPERQVLKRG